MRKINTKSLWIIFMLVGNSGKLFIKECKLLLVK
jgi:hypothetical protein